MKQRVITGAIMLAVFVPLLIIGGIPLYCLIAAAIGWSMYELMRATEGKIGKDSITKRCLSWPAWLIALSTVLTILGALYPYFINLFSGNGFIFSNIMIPVIPFVILTFSLFGSAVFNKNVEIQDVFLVISMSMFLMLGGQSFSLIRDMGGNFITFVLLTCFLTDIFAYLVGMFCSKRFTTHKLNERISPKKTIEGSIGGIVGGTLFPFLFTLIPNMNLAYDKVYGITLEWWMVLILAFVLSLVAQIGDLTFSAIKRKYNIKDYSNLFPGHGGVLDRLDSVLFNMIFFALIVSIIANGNLF